ncbi:class I SAM-dependent methyltransferase [Desnuesiella massiliensis]|uniref:class I SAM-dependent methyltransferase n=1 Tax=Desnuesiella massiliensis TaxID=1650662 RepID=UPI0006E40BF6|nr:class I SAM-dependent methyltransferase [Desnuesiella massiliensis]
MVKSKEWNWSVVTDSSWNEPSGDVYYYVNRWKKKNLNSFLDLGCGLGRHSILFAENGFDTYSIDLSQYGIEVLDNKASELGLDIKTTVGDIHNLPFDANMFDCLLAYHTISHTDTRGIKIIISEINRVLKTNGEFFATLCSKHGSAFTNKPYPRIDENTILRTEEPELNVPHFYTDLDGVRNLFKDFELIKIRHIEDIFNDTSSWHYFIHGIKRE